MLLRQQNKKIAFYMCEMQAVVEFSLLIFLESVHLKPSLDYINIKSDPDIYTSNTLNSNRGGELLKNGN